MEKAVFLDKDGTLIIDVPFNVDIRKVQPVPDLFSSLKALQDAGYLLVIITNQSGIALSYFTISDLEKFKKYFIDWFAGNEIVLAGFYYCPHFINGNNPDYSITCDCRKPLPGLLLQAAAELNIDLNNSWMIGDILNDIEAGSRAGGKTVLVNNGNETEWLNGQFRNPTFVAANLSDAVNFITGKYMKDE